MRLRLAGTWSGEEAGGSAEGRKGCDRARPSNKEFYSILLSYRRFAI